MTTLTASTPVTHQPATGVVPEPCQVRVIAHFIPRGKGAPIEQDVTSWLEQAPDMTLRVMAVEQWAALPGKHLIASTVAGHYKVPVPVDRKYSMQIDEQMAFAWLRANRPAVWESIPLKFLPVPAVALPTDTVFAIFHPAGEPPFSYDVTGWLAQTSSLSALAMLRWSCGTSYDTLSREVADHYGILAGQGFGVQFDEDRTLAWLKVHRPEVWEELKRED